MIDVPTAPQRLYQGVPGTGETTLYTAKKKVIIRSIHYSGDATGGTITVHNRPGGAAAAAANALAQAFAVAAAAVGDLAGQAGVPGAIVMEAGDVLSAAQSSGTHITLTVSGEVQVQN